MVRFLSLSVEVDVHDDDGGDVTVVHQLEFHLVLAFLVGEAAGIVFPVTNGLVVEETLVVHQLDVDVVLRVVDLVFEVTLVTPFGVVAVLVFRLPVGILEFNLEEGFDLVNDTFALDVGAEGAELEVSLVSDHTKDIFNYNSHN